MINEDNIWYHGTPDSREIKKTNSFRTIYATRQIISDINKYNEIQNNLKKARKDGNEDLYFELLDTVSDTYGEIKFKKPIFFTDKSSVANTYTDPFRAFDYQNAEPSLLKVEINENGKLLEVHAYGYSFRKIELKILKDALIKDGVQESEIDNYYNMFTQHIGGRGNKLSTEDSGIICQLLGYDIVDFIGVLDGYHGGKTQSTVRMLFDAERIKILN